MSRLFAAYGSRVPPTAAGGIGPYRSSFMKVMKEHPRNAISPFPFPRVLAYVFWKKAKRLSC